MSQARWFQGRVIRNYFVQQKSYFENKIYSVNEETCGFSGNRKYILSYALPHAISIQSTSPQPVCLRPILRHKIHTKFNKDL